MAVTSFNGCVYELVGATWNRVLYNVEKAQRT